jgi:copper chaperone NosL
MMSGRRDMRSLLENLNRHLDAKLGFASRLLLVTSALLLAVALTLPLWNLTMYAPQYPDGLSMDIYPARLEGGRGGQDIKEINLLNHYIGMRDLTNEDFTEFKWMPFAIGALALVFLRSAVHGSMTSLVDAVVLFAYFGAFSLWSFAHKLYVYGHNLAPTAPVKVPPFTPPMFGYQQIANFGVYSFPQVGSYVMGAAGLALLIALTMAWRNARSVKAAPQAVSAGEA